MGSALLLCIFIFSHSGNGKQVTCEAGSESFLVLCPPVCLRRVRSAASVLTSSLWAISPSCSLEDGEDHGAKGPGDVPTELTEI